MEVDGQAPAPADQPQQQGEDVNFVVVYGKVNSQVSMPSTVSGEGECANKGFFCRGACPMGSQGATRRARQWVPYTCVASATGLCRGSDGVAKGPGSTCRNSAHGSLQDALCTLLCCAAAEGFTPASAAIHAIMSTSMIKAGTASTHTYLQATVGQLKQKIEESTRIVPSGQKLLNKGKDLKDDTLTLQQVGV